jgi:hypothetical protein
LLTISTFVGLPPFCKRIARSTRSAVPAGTVDFCTRTSPSFACLAISRTARSTAIRLASPVVFAGVPTQTNTTSTATAVAVSVVNTRRPASRFSDTNSSRPGSKNGVMPRFSWSIFSWSTSVPTTSCPICANDAAATSPTWPVPMTPILINRSSSTIRRHARAPAAAGTRPRSASCDSIQG